MKNFLEGTAVILLLSFVQSKVTKSLIPNFEQEVGLFKEKKMWFPDWNGKPVPVKLEMPNHVPKLKDLNKAITFGLYTRETGDEYQILKINELNSISQSYFNPNRPTKFFSHGFRTDVESLQGPCKKFRKASLEHEDCNLIIINWTSISYNLYTVIKIYMNKIGQYVASMIDFLETKGMNLNTTTLIGISLGAHVVGVAGYHAKNKVNYIVGLDPAWPLYAFCGPNSRISSESGNHVEIIHTNGGLLGHPAVLGHFDFYPNGGGLNQPGCIIDIVGLCSHNRALDLYIESLSSANGFYGMECNSYEHFKYGSCNGYMEIMGGTDPTHKKKGIYYLDTNGFQPYAQGKISGKTQ